MEFSGDIGALQRRIADLPEGRDRREAVLEAIAPGPGEAVLDLGCGGGHLLLDLAHAVGPTGRAVGLDVSVEQVAAADRRTGEAPAAETAVGDATALPFEDDAFSAIASIQTLEYIANLDAALAQCRRVIAPGGRVAFVSVLWDHWRFHGAERDLTDRVLELFRAHCPHQMLPLEMPARLTRAGFREIARRPLMFMNERLDERRYSGIAAQVAALFATSHGMAKDDARRWLDQLAEADREGRFGFVSIPILTTARAA